MSAILDLLCWPNKEKELNQAFRAGRDSGYEEGLRDGLSMNFKQGEALSEKEYNEVIEFLISKGVELVCYDVDRGGLRIKKAVVQKRNYPSNP